MIYAISCRGALKFGVARNPKARLKELQTGNPNELKLEVALSLTDDKEKQIHRWLKSECIRGEWFCGPLSYEVLLDLKARHLCGGDPNETGHPDYPFWWAVIKCGGSCAEKS